MLLRALLLLLVVKVVLLVLLPGSHRKDCTTPQHCPQRWRISSSNNYRSNLPFMCQHPRHKVGDC